MKSFIFISLITIFLSKIVPNELETEYFQNISYLIKLAHENKTISKPEYILDEEINYAKIRLDTSSTQKIDDAFIEKYNLPKSLKSVFQEIYIDNDSDEIYHKIEGLKKGIISFNPTIYYLIHSHYKYSQPNPYKIDCSVFTTFKFKLEVKFESNMKTICNKGLMILTYIFLYLFVLLIHPSSLIPFSILFSQKKCPRAHIHSQRVLLL